MPENPYTYYRASRSAAQHSAKKRSGAAAKDYIESQPRPPVATINGVDVYNPTAEEAARLGLGYVYEPGSSLQSSNMPEPYNPVELAQYQQDALTRALNAGSPADNDPLYHPDRRTQEFKRQQQATYVGNLLNEKAANPAANFDQFVKDMFNVMGDMIDARDKALAEGRADVAAQYDRQIQELQAQVAKARQGQIEGNEAYAKYRAKVDPLFAEHLVESDASLAAEERIKARAGEALADANESQAEATSAFDDMLVKIGVDNIDAAAALHAEAAVLDEMGEDFILGAGEDASRIAALQSELIDKTVTSIKSQDEFVIESARVQLEKQFDARIDALKDRQKQVSAEKNAALAKFTKDFEASYGDLPFGNPDEVWNYMAGAWAEKQGWDYQHIADVNNEVDNLWNGGIRSAEEYREYAREQIMQHNVATLIENNAMYSGDPNAAVGQIEALMASDAKFRRIMMGELDASYGSSLMNGVLNFDGVQQYDQHNRDAAGMFDLRSRLVREYGDLSREVDAFGEYEMNPLNGWVNPVGSIGEFSNSFGYQKPESKGGHIHKGVDIYAPRGSYIYSPEGGEVIAVGTGNVSGNYIKIRSDTGIVYYVAHMDGMSHLSKGDRVRAGATVGNVGNSGNARGTSPHAHFEMRKGNEWINPYSWLQAARSGGGQVSSNTYSFSSGGSPQPSSTGGGYQGPQ